MTLQLAREAPAPILSELCQVLLKVYLRHKGDFFFFFLVAAVPERYSDLNIYFGGLALHWCHLHFKDFTVYVFWSVCL